MDVRQLAIDSFRNRFQAEPDFVACAPGRVNLLGEHVDYNDGFVLPVAIDRSTYVAFRASGSELTTILARDLNQEVSFTSSSAAEKKNAAGGTLPSWGLYPAGVQQKLAEHGLQTPGIEAAFCSDVPRGAGLSSSASVEVVFGVTWQKLGGWTLPLMDLARLCQRAEVEYVGVNSGIMDQFASLCGLEDRALCLDCRSLKWVDVPIPADIAIVIADTSIRRSLAGSAYNDRHDACIEAVRLLQKELPDIHSLRDVDLNTFNKYADQLPPVIEKRARHVVEEIARTAAGVEYLLAGDVIHFGQLMNQGHASLRDLYEVSSPELDTMVSIAQSLSGCLGARLTGAGFGGCTVNLVERSVAQPFTQLLAQIYEDRTGLHPEIYICHASNGAGVEDYK